MTTLKVKLSPGSHANKIWGWDGDRLKISVTAVAEGGKANEAMIDLLAKRLHHAPSSFRVVYGLSSREKTLEVWNLGPEHLEARLAKVGIKKSAT